VAAAIGMEGTPLNLALLERALREEPNSFEFFAAVRHLQRLHPERRAPGGFGDPDGEVVRIGTNPGLGYPASEIQALDAEGDGPARMHVNFMGLTGPVGVLPYVYSQLVLERLASRDEALAAFLDLFHHRAISLFYAAWEKHRFSERHARDGRDPLTDHLLDLAGIGLDTERNAVGVPAESLSQYAGLLGPEQRSAVALEQMLSDFFDVPVGVEQFLGGWYPVATPDQCALDEPVNASRLGWGALVGDEIWDPQGRVRVRMGPLTRTQYDRLLPTGEDHAKVRRLVRLFGHGQFDFELQLVLVRDDVPGVVIGSEDEGQKLGWSTWVRTVPRVADAEETVLGI
jgi:type VI secretion system protein ImpH